MDYNRWIWSKEIAAWLFKETTLSMEEQAICICTAPHRTIAEKLQGIRELNGHSRIGCLESRIKAMETVLRRVYSEMPMEQYLYGAEIYWCGNREEFQTQVIYRTAKEAIQDIRKRIEDTSVQTERKRESFYGVVPVFLAAASGQYRLVENLIIRYDGEIIYCQPDFDYDDTWSCIAPEPFNVMRIPYPSGTIVEIEENPFIPSVKGVLVNLEAEPGEDGFGDYNRFYQWMLYQEHERIHLTHEIGVAVLRDDYVPFPVENFNVIFPYRQFIRKCDKRKKNDIWLEELSKLVKMDKRCVDCILADRQPGKGTNPNDRRLQYVRRLQALCRISSLNV